MTKGHVRVPGIALFSAFIASDAQLLKRRLKLQEPILGPLGIQLPREACEFRNYAPGETVFQQDDPGDQVYLSNSDYESQSSASRKAYSRSGCLKARHMGLDISRDALLWRDRALIELNVAVLYSFEKAGITMMDHHSAAQSSDRFEEIEKRSGRVVYGIWSWLVPPIWGSAVSVFHCDWPGVEIKSNFSAQENFWEE